MNRKLKYNYVIFGTNMDLYRIAYSDLHKISEARYLEEGIYSNNFILKALFKIHTSQRINMIVDIPFKRVWNKFAFVNDFQNNNPICYIFFAGTYWFTVEYISFLRKNQPNCKIVIFYQDLIKTHEKLFEETRRLTDLNISFDQGDAEKYKIVYHPLVYSYHSNIENKGYKSDVYFVGKAKDRLDLILSVYEKLKQFGLQCDFHITGVPKNYQKYPDEIDYCRQMSYDENLSHILGTKCVLEIMQGGGKGFTLRYAEALMYDKKMITNNTEIEKATFFSNDKIMIINDANDINLEFIKKINERIQYDCKEKLSPIAFLEFIDSLL